MTSYFERSGAGGARPFATTDFRGSSDFARKTSKLEERMQRQRPKGDGPSGRSAPRGDIGQLKEFYLQRLAKVDPSTPARFGAAPMGSFKAPAGDTSQQPQASGQHAARPTYSGSTAAGAAGAGAGAGTIPTPGGGDIEDMEVMCNNCYNLIRSSDAARCTGEASGCPIAKSLGHGEAPPQRPAGKIAELDVKLSKLRVALESRLQDKDIIDKVPVMRHLMQMKYHMDAALKWTPACPEIGLLSTHTVQGIKSLTSTAKVLAPAVYIFSKRIENVIVQKERELRKVMVQPAVQTAPGGLDQSRGGIGSYDGAYPSVETMELSEDTQFEVNSVNTNLDSDTGTQAMETQITQEGPTGDVGNVQDADHLMNLKSEEDQRKWFYTQCLSVKLACADKVKARKTLISDLYAKVQAEQVPIGEWVDWMKAQLGPEPAAGMGGVGGLPARGLPERPAARRPVDVGRPAQGFGTAWSSTNPRPMGYPSNQ